ncbi:hypothetical protein CAPTEDRAFT_213887 [Capitella teleta]|uniref:Protein kinase domain-containing protein n=1 Tax=Capitella teleta TaxID=283909 RepID=R7T6T2_CAPTE|nr:hypothetical protein CAPTEDRAFT_213887 [Capitella teleta]|eukprot:ELT89289.1 hypothetical protein CAPTEDRAFT_213887 [Capitella teleta]
MTVEKPNKAQLTSDSDDVTEDDDFSLTCASTSTSLPEDNRSDVPMTYQWTRDDQDVDPDVPPDRHLFPESDRSVLEISPVHKGDTAPTNASVKSRDPTWSLMQAKHMFLMSAKYRKPKGTQRMHIGLLIIFSVYIYAFSEADDVELDPNQSPVTVGEAAAPGGVYDTIDPLRVIDPLPEYKAIETYEEIKLEDTESYLVMMRRISISELNIGSSQSVDSMLIMQKGTLNVEHQPPTNILIVQPQTKSAQEYFAARYLEGQLGIVEELRNISNIEIPLGFVLQQGLRQSVFKQLVLLSEHLEKDKLIYANMIPKSQQIYQNARTMQPDLHNIFVGISNGLAQLHEVRALVYGLNTGSVFIHEENGRLTAKLSGFSDASLVRQRDRLDFEMEERDVRRLAPETIASLEHICKSDVWVMAVFFGEITSGRVPYKAFANDMDAEAAILRGLKLEKPAGCTPTIGTVKIESVNVINKLRDKSQKETVYGWIDDRNNYVRSRVSSGIYAGIGFHDDIICCSSGSTSSNDSGPSYDENNGAIISMSSIESSCKQILNSDANAPSEEYFIKVGDENMFTDKASFLMRTLRSNTSQTYAVLKQHSSFRVQFTSRSIPLKIGLNQHTDYQRPIHMLGDYLYFGCIPRSRAAHRTIQGVNINGNNKKVKG